MPRGHMTFECGLPALPVQTSQWCQSLAIVFVKVNSVLPQLVSDQRDLCGDLPLAQLQIATAITHSSCAFLTTFSMRDNCQMIA